MIDEDDLDNIEIKRSPYCRKVKREGFTVEILIYRIVELDYLWILEVIDDEGASTVWDEQFETDEEAFQEVMNTIEEEGISTFIRPPDSIIN
jgi:hypothetical protein